SKGLSSRKNRMPLIDNTGVEGVCACRTGLTDNAAVAMTSRHNIRRREIRKTMKCLLIIESSFELTLLPGALLFFNLDVVKPDGVDFPVPQSQIDGHVLVIFQRRELTFQH